MSTGAMRLLAQGSILVLWLSVSVLVCIDSVGGARKMLLLAHDGAKVNDSLTTALETISKCKLKNPCFSPSAEKMMIKSDTNSFEEKRVVPTGPNPLHNK